MIPVFPLAVVNLILALLRNPTDPFTPFLVTTAATTPICTFDAGSFLIVIVIVIVICQSPGQTILADIVPHNLLSTFLGDVAAPFTAVPFFRVAGRIGHCGDDENEEEENALHNVGFLLPKERRGG